MTLAITPAIGAAVLGSFITNSWPLPTDPAEVKMLKTSRLAAAFTASAFTGLVAGVVTSEIIK